MSFYTNRLKQFLETKTDVEISAQPALEDQNLDFSDVEQLLGSINTIPVPSAPVINPQAPNSATGSSVRVCWSLYSDDTVESYQLSYRPVQEGSPGKDQAGETVPGTQPRSRMARAPRRPWPCLLGSWESGDGISLLTQPLGAVTVQELPRGCDPDR